MFRSAAGVGYGQGGSCVMKPFRDGGYDCMGDRSNLQKPRLTEASQGDKGVAFGEERMTLDKKTPEDRNVVVRSMCLVDLGRTRSRIVKRQDGPSQRTAILSKHRP